MPAVTKKMQKEFTSLKRRMNEGIDAQGPVDVSEEYTPSLYIDNIEVPGLSELEPGDSFTATVKGRLNGKSMHKGKRGSDSSLTLDIEEIAVD